MTKQPKDFLKTSPLQGSLGTSGKWKETWNKIADDNKDSVTRIMNESLNSSVPWVDKPLFNPKKIKKLFSQSMQTLGIQPEGDDNSFHHQFINVQDFIHTTLKQLQKKGGKVRSRRKKQESLEGEENPFYYLLHQSYLLNLQFLKDAASRHSDLDPHINRKLRFYTHHLVDALSITNHPKSNPKNLQGALAPLPVETEFHVSSEGTMRKVASEIQVDLKNGFSLGENIAVTPGKVVFQNKFFQLIQYAPLTAKVAKRPLLIVPPWFNKYYIFDLSKENSFVRWAVESGLSVFIISWVNPNQQLNRKTMTDYVLDGVKAAVDQVCQITQEKQLNAVGYCAGGTLLSSLMAYLKVKKDESIASATFLATPFNFSKSDELGIYRCETQKEKLEDHVAEKGDLDGQYMVEAMNLLRTNDLIWSTDVNHYLLGRKSFPFDMLYWTCDALRVPVKMHQSYLRDMLLENKLMMSEALSINDTPLDLQKITAPIFLLAAYEDHIAPWRSVYAHTQMTQSTSQEFILTGSGHIKGVFNPPASQNYHFWKAEKLSKEGDDWLKSAKRQSGSWWNEWRKWLKSYDGGQVKARTIAKDRILEDAPGRYARASKDLKKSKEM